MSDQATWEVHGPVHTLRVEHTEWDISREEWQPARSFTMVRFRPDGMTQVRECHNPDGSVALSNYLFDDSGRLVERQFRIDAGPLGRTRHTYDGAGRLTQTVEVAVDGTTRQSEVLSYDSVGRKTKVLFLPSETPGLAISYAMEGSPSHYGAPGAVTITVLYDEHDRPAETLFHDARQRLVTRIVFDRDAEGRLLSETQVAGEGFVDFEQALASTPEENREQARAILAGLLGPGRSTSRITYNYDLAGRLSERHVRCGDLGGHRTTYVYGSEGQVTEETTENYTRSLGLDKSGNTYVVSEESSRQHLRLEYHYDEQGNWTDRVVWSRLEPNPNFERSNAVRREITYYGG